MFNRIFFSGRGAPNSTRPTSAKTYLNRVVLLDVTALKLVI
jgi:hypothetical protein